MASAIINKTIIDFESINKSDIQNFVTLRANGSVIKFDGFLKIYNEGVDEKNSSESFSITYLCTKLLFLRQHCDEKTD